MMKRILYFGYYVKNLNWKLLRSFINHAYQIKNRSKLLILVDVFISSFRYNISILEYFQFRFYELNHDQRKTWAGSGFIYEYQMLMNPLNKRNILDDKTLFAKKYSSLIFHKAANLNELILNKSLTDEILQNNSGKVVFKVADGKCGKQVAIRPSTDFNKTNIISFMKQNEFDLVEEYIIQHKSLMEMSPSAVNTIRIFTQLNSDNKVEILGSRLRISVNSKVDNMAAGNIAACIDDVTGIVNGPGVYSDITKPDETVHPITGVSISGFKIPFWNETLSLVHKAALLHPQNRSIGWDIAMLETGPDLIEGNHDWCKLLWQLPVKKGLKPVLKRHLNEYKKK